MRRSRAAARAPDRSPEAPLSSPRTILVTGGARSGKSRHAEALVAEHPRVTYVAPGRVPDPEADPDWAERVAKHRDRRPEHWTTVETTDLALAVTSASGAVLVDCLGTWVTRLVDDAHAWEQPYDEVRALMLEHTEALVRALRDLDGDVVLVTNEVGLGVVPEHRSGRLFRDLLGEVNQRVGTVCDDVHLVVAGRVLTL